MMNSWVNKKKPFIGIPQLNSTFTSSNQIEENSISVGFLNFISVIHKEASFYISCLLLYAICQM